MICLSGPYDLDLAYRHSDRQHQKEGQSVRGMLEAFLGASVQKSGQTYLDASPITYADKSTVPALLTHGDADPLVPIEQTELFCAALKKKGVDVDFMRIEGAGHADFGKKPQQVVDRLDAFINKHLLSHEQSRSSIRQPSQGDRYVLVQRAMARARCDGPIPVD